MTSVRPATSPSTSTSKQLAAKLARIDVKRWGRVDHSLAYAPQYLYHIDRHQCSFDSTTDLPELVIPVANMTEESNLHHESSMSGSR
jgi:hypothetical protein